MIWMHIDVKKCDLREGGVPTELDEITAVETSKELPEEIGAMGLKRKMLSINPSQRLTVCVKTRE